MDSIASARRLVMLLFFVGSGVMLAQSTLPATSPTEPTPASPPPVTSTVATRAVVSYTKGQIEITADNSSLNQILREISRQTGMTIVGGVADQRVFGKYGPASPADILARLLDGTGSNMLLLNNASNAPAQLILTPQQGGPTPPNPNASLDEDSSAVPLPQSEDLPTRPAYDPNMQSQLRSRSGVMAGQNASNSSTAPATDPGTNPPATDNPPSPNGVKTPQQIYQQLQQLQQAQPKQ